jgi:hypothetical protein
MVFKTGIVVMAPDADPQKHRARIRTSTLEQIVVLTELFNVAQAVSVCKDLVQKDAVQSLILCPGFTHEAVAKIAAAVGEGISINVARGDVPSTMATAAILSKEGWFPEGH